MVWILDCALTYFMSCFVGKVNARVECLMQGINFHEFLMQQLTSLAHQSYVCLAVICLKLTQVYWLYQFFVLSSERRWSGTWVTSQEDWLLNCPLKKTVATRLERFWSVFYFTLDFWKTVMCFYIVIKLLLTVKYSIVICRR